MPGLWRKRGIKGGKYLVTRRDGSIPDWMWFVLGSRDPAAPAALRSYADKAEELGYDADYVSDVRELADDYENELCALGVGDPTAPPHRTDDPSTVSAMESADKSA